MATSIYTPDYLDDSLQINHVDGGLSIASSRDMQVDVYNQNGQKIASLHLSKGHKKYIVPKKGVYLINKQKIVVGN